MRTKLLLLLAHLVLVGIIACQVYGEYIVYYGKGLGADCEWEPNAEQCATGCGPRTIASGYSCGGPTPNCTCCGGGIAFYECVDGNFMPCPQPPNMISRAAYTCYTRDDIFCIQGANRCDTLPPPPGP